MKKQKREIIFKDDTCSNVTNHTKSYLESLPNEILRIIFYKLSSQTWRLKVSKFLTKFYFDTTYSIVITSGDVNQKFDGVFDLFKNNGTKIKSFVLWMDNINDRLIPRSEYECCGCGISSPHYVPTKYLLMGGNFRNILYFKNTLVSIIIGRHIDYFNSSHAEFFFQTIYECINLEILEVDCGPNAMFSVTCLSGLKNLLNLRYFKLLSIKADHRLSSYAHESSSGDLCVSSPGIMDEFAALKNLECLSLWISQGWTDFCDLKHLKHLTKLREITISGIYFNTECPEIRESFEILSKPNIKSISLLLSEHSMQYHNLTPLYLGKLLSNQSLKRLHLENWILSDDDSKYMKESKNMEYLIISYFGKYHHTQKLNASFFGAIRFSNITWIRLKGCDVKGTDFYELEHFLKLEKIQFQNIENFNDLCLNILSKNQLIKHIALCSIDQITNEGIKNLVMMGNLREIIIENCKNVTRQSINYLKKGHINFSIGMLKINSDLITNDIFEDSGFDDSNFEEIRLCDL
jgi:hypothetical protein